MQNEIQIISIIIACVFFHNATKAQCIGKVNYINNKAELNKCFDQITQKHDLNVPKIVFTMKIDSLGEVHSCHIRGNDSLTQIKLYSICCEIECCVNAQFLYKEFKWSFPNERYVYVNYPFKPK